MQGNLIVVATAFALSVLVLIGVGLFVLMLLIEARRRHRKRLARVSRRRMSGRLDLDDARLMLLAKPKDETSPWARLSDSLAGVLPILDTARLRANARRAGMSLTIGGFIAASAVVALGVAALGAYLLGMPLPLMAPPALVIGMFLVDRVVILRGNAMANRFMTQLPEALDTIIRGVRSGLPVIECIGTVGEEFDDPIGGYFKSMSERVSLGESLDGALWRTARVIDKPEMDFLAIAIAIQIETGGSLTEALGNLADLLRQRQRMKLKVKAISSEAKASALIIGALPFVMLGLLTFMNPAYTMPLFTDPRGQMMLLAGLGSISIGAFVMWRMTQFEI